MIINLGLGGKRGERTTLQRIAVNLLHATQWLANRGHAPVIVWPSADAEPTLVATLPDSHHSQLGGLLLVADQDCLAYKMDTGETGFFGATELQPAQWEPSLFYLPNGRTFKDFYGMRNAPTSATIPRRDYGPKA